MLSSDTRRNIRRSDIKSLLQKSPVKETNSAKETNNLIDHTNRSHPICIYVKRHV